MAYGMVKYEIGMTLTPYGTGVKCKVVGMDQDMDPPKWLKLQDIETKEVHIYTEDDYGWDEYGFHGYVT